MNNVKNSFSIVGVHFRKWRSSPRIYVLIIFLLLFQLTMSLPVHAFCNDAGYRINFAAFTFFYSGEYQIMMIMLGIILLFCDAPFIEDTQVYVLLRSGRRVWTAGQLMYIVFGSILYSLFLFILSVVTLIPNVTFMGDWGRVINTLSTQGSGLSSNYNISTYFSPDIVALMNPLKATLWTFLFITLVGCFLGLLMFALNLYFKRVVGSLLASFLVLTSFILTKASGRWLAHFSPVSWSSVTLLDFQHNSEYPSPEYALIMLGVMIAACIIISFYQMNKRDIDVMKTL